MNEALLDQPDSGDHLVTVSVSRKITPGREADFEDWIKRIAKVAEKFKGQQGLSVLRPSDQTGGRYVLIYRFDTQTNADAWEQSVERAHWIAKLDGISEGEVHRKTATGLEVWFDLPEVPAATQPPRYKMAVVLIAVIFGLVWSLQVFLGPYIAHWPRWSQVLTIVTIQVISMTYLIMPAITGILKRWLFRKGS